MGHCWENVLTSMKHDQHSQRAPLCKHLCEVYEVYTYINCRYRKIFYYSNCWKSACIWRNKDGWMMGQKDWVMFLIWEGVCWGFRGGWIDGRLNMMARLDGSGRKTDGWMEKSMTFLKGDENDGFWGTLMKPWTVGGKNDLIDNVWVDWLMDGWWKLFNKCVRYGRLHCAHRMEACWSEQELLKALLSLPAGYNLSWRIGSPFACYLSWRFRFEANLPT